MKQTALVLLVPEAAELVWELRLRYDPSAALGFPEHITLLFPFVEPEAIDEAELRAFFARVPAFDFTLPRTERFPEALYLAPEPSAPILALIDAIMARWPGYPPYGNPDLEVVPHLTLAYQQSEEVFDDVASKVCAGLPLSAHAGEVHLAEGGPVHTANWRLRACFPLGHQA